MKQVILSLLLLTVALVAQAQTKLVFEETVPEAYLIKQASASNTSQVNINSIIALLGKADGRKEGGRPGRTAEFIVRFEQQARIEGAGDKLVLLVQLGKFTASSDFYYREFDVTDVLQPERLNAKIKLLDANNREVQVFDLQNVLLNKDKVILLETTIPDSVAYQGYKLKVESKELVFTNEDVRQVQQRIDLVQDYYAADASVTEALQEMQRIAPDDLDRLTQHDRHLRTLEGLYEKLQNNPFNETLDLKQHDSQGYIAKIDRFNQLLNGKRRAINHTLATLDQQFYNRAVDFALAGNMAGAQNYLLKSIEVNPNFAPSHLQLAKLDFRKGYIQEATDRMYHLLTKMRVDPETKQQALVLAHDIYSTFITRGNNHTTRGEYDNALAAYSEARALCSTIGGLRCNLPALNDGESRAAYGAYGALVSDGKRFLAQNDFVRAEQLATEALRFQKEYDHVLHSATDATDLQNQVQYHFYVKHIDNGKRYLNEKNNEAALGHFEAALDMEKEFGFQRVQHLVVLAQKAAKPVMLKELRKGYDEARNNRLAEARTLASKVVAMQTRYGLNQDKDIESSYSLLRERITTQECANVQTAYDSHFQKAKALSQNKDYLAADKAYKAALDVAGGNVVCQVATFTAQDGREAIETAVAYQRMLADIDRFVASSRYTEAIEYYVKAEKHYVTNQINKFGLDHISLFNYAKSSKKQPFTANVVQYFISLGEEKAALNLLASLLHNGYSKGKTKKMQEQLGKRLAEKDVQLDLQDSPKERVVVYVNGNRKLSNFGKAYMKERKRLVKS